MNQQFFQSVLSQLISSVNHQWLSNKGRSLSSFKMECSVRCRGDRSRGYLEEYESYCQNIRTSWEPNSISKSAASVKKVPKIFGKFFSTTICVEFFLKLFPSIFHTISNFSKSFSNTSNYSQKLITNKNNHLNNHHLKTIYHPIKSILNT